MTANGTKLAPVTAADLTRFPEIRAVGLSADGALAAAIVSVPDTIENRYIRNVVVGSVGNHAPWQPVAPAADGHEVLAAWSPAGHDLATVRHDEDGWSIWRHGIDDGTASPVVTGWPDPVEELSWSPAGDRLLFVAREPTDRAWWQLPEDRRPPLRITTLRHREDGIGWTVNRPRQAYVVALGQASGGGAQPRRVSSGGYDDAEFGWHPDGRRVVFVSQRQPGADHTIVNDVYLQDLDSDAPAVRLTPTTHAYAQPRISPDGALVAFTATDVPHFPATAALAVAPVSGGEVTILSGGLDRDCSNLTWTDASHVAVLADDRGAIHAYRFDATTPDQYQLVIGGERRVSSFDERGGARVFVITTPDQPPQLVAQTGGGGETVLLTPSADAAAARDLRGPEHRPVVAADGTVLDSWLTLPDPDHWQAPYPLLLCLQGGGSQYGYQWSPEFQALLGPASPPCT